MRLVNLLLSVLVLRFSVLVSHTVSFQSDKLLVDNEEFGLEGAQSRPEIDISSTTGSTIPPTPTTAIRRKSTLSNSDSKVEFTLEQAFGDSDFTSVGTFTAHLKSWSHGGQELLEADDFYRIRLPSNVLNPPGRNYTVSAVKVRCLSKESLDEHFVIHMEGVNILVVNYGSPGACPYPRQMKLPDKWSFNSHAILKYSEQAPRTPVFTEEMPSGEISEGLKPPEKSFFAKYWMYLIPLGIMVMNAVTQAMNVPMPEEGAGQPAAARGAGPSGRRR